jgi:proton glutamate symport protein
MKVSNHRTYSTYHPAFVLLALILGACLGIFFKQTAKQLAIFANMYLSLLQMCLIPLILTAIPVALSRMVKMKLAGKLFLRLVVVYVVTSLSASLFGVVCGLVAHWVHPVNEASLSSLGQLLINESAIDSASILHANFHTFVQNLFPSNIFAAVVEGRGIQILTFSVFLGFALGVLALDVASPAVRVFRGIYKSFVNIVSGILVVLPIGLFFLIGSYIASFPHQVWLTLRDMVLANLIGCLLLGLALFYVLSAWLRRKFWYTLNRLKSILLISLFSFSGFVVLPLVLRLFGRNFDLDEEEVSLFYPLGVALHPLGAIFFFSIFSIFITSIYGYQVGVFDVVKIVFFSLIASIPIGGLYYRVPKSMLYVTMAILLHPMGLPASTAVLLMLVGHALFMPIINVVNVIGNCLGVALIVRKREKPVLDGAQVAEVQS